MKATLLTAVALMNPGIALAQDEPVNFAFGDDCEKLEDLTYESLQLLSLAVQDQDVDRFCAAADPFDCADYNWTVELFGVLMPARTAGYCRYVPEPLSQREGPSLPNNRA